MNTVVLEFPMFEFIVATRAILGVGVGLLVASRVPEAQRRLIGLALLGIGAASTIPAVAALMRARKEGNQLELGARVSPVM
jgi:hypothetical protein